MFLLKHHSVESGLISGHQEQLALSFSFTFDGIAHSEFQGLNLRGREEHWQKIPNFFLINPYWVYVIHPFCISPGTFLCKKVNSESGQRDSETQTGVKRQKNTRWISFEPFLLFCMFCSSRLRCTSVIEFSTIYIFYINLLMLIG